MMSFGLKNVSSIFSRVVVILRLMLDKCIQYHISLNLKKCIFCAPFGILLGHVVCKQGLLMDPAKIAVIFYFLPPTSV
jgi:hypothetical protein